MSLSLQETKVSNAVSLILSLESKRKKSDVLNDEFQPIQLQINVKKIPPTSKKIKLKLPHAIAKPDADVCLFVKDAVKDGRETDPTIHYFEEILSKKEVSNIKEIIPVQALKTDYLPYEAKYNLSNAYDVYLADERVVTILPRLLGKSFYGRKRIPTQINLLAKDLKAEIHKALNSCKATVSNKGSTSMVVIGHNGMSQENLTSNVLAAVEQISSAMPGTSDNIKQLCLKARFSSSIPLFMSKGGPQDIKIAKPKPKSEGKFEVDELSTIDGQVAVHPDGRVIVLKDGQTLEEFKKIENDVKNRKRKLNGNDSEKKLRPHKKVKISKEAPSKKIKQLKKEKSKKEKSGKKIK